MPSKSEHTSLPLPLPSPFTTHTKIMADLWKSLPWYLKVAVAAAAAAGLREAWARLNEKVSTHTHPTSTLSPRVKVHKQQGLTTVHLYTMYRT